MKPRNSSCCVGVITLFFRLIMNPSPIRKVITVERLAAASAWVRDMMSISSLDGGPATDTDEQISVGTKDDENDQGISRRRLGLAVSHDGPDIASADCLPWRTINYLNRRLGLTVSYDGSGIASADCLPWRTINYLHRRLGLTVSHDGPGIASADCLPWQAMNYL